MGAGATLAEKPERFHWGRMVLAVSQLCRASVNNAIKKHEIMYRLIAAAFAETESRSGQVTSCSEPIPLKIHRVCDMLHAKSCIVAKGPHAGMVRKYREGGQHGCCSSHLAVVQNYEVHPKVALVLLQNETLI
ncbi:hypothetical protein AVEN_31881-1 [Araneus ventricosus]|uniref:Uncharacterized protein n=1 Tax=Araneus ventricosus TaxID=182803 RepID=A0A4Y2F9X7_ARAVE|nr:hypothetical protein AVEN_31881-1 [Araneus ventricosus]